jgi:hypothetical protein
VAFWPPGRKTDGPATDKAAGPFGFRLDPAVSRHQDAWMIGFTV